MCEKRFSFTCVITSSSRGMWLKNAVSNFEKMPFSEKRDSSLFPDISSQFLKLNTRKIYFHFGEFCIIKRLFSYRYKECRKVVARFVNTRDNL